VADRSVVFRFLSDTTGLKKGFSEAGKTVQESEGIFAKLEGKLSGISSGAVASAAGIAGVATSIVGFATMAVHRLGEEQVAAAQTAAVILSTGGAALVSAGHVHTMADSLAKLSGVDDEVVQGGESLLLTFTNIKNGVGAGNDVFDQTTKAALDMSVALGEDMSAASMQLGKALQDPVAGLTALRRVGVLFTDEQKRAIAAMVATGDTLGAQKIILAEVNREFGGSAEAYGKTIPGAIGRARTAFENFSADVAKKALPAVQSFGRGVADVARVVGPTLVAALNAVGGVIAGVGKFAKDHSGYVVAMAAAYAVSLVPAIWTAVVAFAALAFAKIAAGIDLVIVSVRVLALEMGALRLALLATGIGAAIVLFGGLMSVMANTKRHAEELAASASKGLDLSTWDGLTDQQRNLSGLLADNAAQFDTFGSTAHAALTSVGQVLNPWSPNTIQENVQGGKALQASLDASIAKMHAYNQNIGAASAATGLNRKQIEALAAAHHIDLTGGIETTTAALKDAYAAQQAAASGWGVYAQSAEDAIATQKALTSAFEAAIDVTKVYSTGAAAAATAAKDANKTVADSIRDRAKAERDAIDTRHDAEKAALAGEFITGKASKAAHDQRVKNLDATQKAENDAADATVASEDKRAGAVESANVRSTLSMEAYRKLIVQNTKDTLAWMKNLAVIAGRGGGDFIDVLAALGPEAAGLVAEIASSTKPKFDQFAATMRAGSKTAVDAAKEQFGKIPDTIGVIGAKAGEAFAAQLLAKLAANKITVDDVFSAEWTLLLSKMLPVPGQPGAYRPVGGGATAVLNAEGHVAQVAPAGSWRVWAEPETGGEAYIPLAQSKRVRSMALLTQVAGQFGHEVIPMAAGGIWGVPLYGADRSAAAGGISQADMGRLLGALERTARRRPAQVQNVFNEKVDPLHVARKIAWALG